jgi:hypothetical protein
MNRWIIGVAAKACPLPGSAAGLKGLEGDPFVSAIGHIILATILAFRIRVWIELAALGTRMGWSRLVDHALARANRLQDDFLLLGLENDLKEAPRQTSATLFGPPNAYSVIQAGNAGYHVIEAQPDGSEPRVLAAFTTRAAATEWLADHLGIPRPPDDNTKDFPLPPFHP